MTLDTPNRPARTAEVIVSAPAEVAPQADDPETPTALLEDRNARVRAAVSRHIEHAHRDAAQGLALRTFRVDPFAGPLCRGALLPVVGTDAAVWGPTGHGIAECGRGRDHLAPDPDCTCGIYATTDINALTAEHPLLASNIVTVVECDPEYSYRDGQTIRAMSGRVLAYWCHPSSRLDSARRVLATTGAEEFTDRDEMITDYLGTEAPRPAAAPALSRAWWRDAVAAAATYGVVPPTLRQHFAVVREALNYVLVPSLLAYGIATIAHAAARPTSGHVDALRLAAQQFVTSGRLLLGWLIDAGMPTTLLVVLLAIGAAKGLLTSRGYPAKDVVSGLASMGANIIRCAGPLILPVVFFLSMLALAAHLPRSMVLDVTAVLAYAAYFGVTFGPTATAAAVSLWRRWRQ
jgi:hypothetical protein